MRLLYLVLWIRSGFNTDPDPFFQLKAETNPDPAKQMRIHADPNLDPPNFAVALQKAVQYMKYCSFHSSRLCKCLWMTNFCWVRAILAPKVDKNSIFGHQVHAGMFVLALQERPCDMIRVQTKIRQAISDIRNATSYRYQHSPQIGAVVFGYWVPSSFPMSSWSPIYSR